MRHVKYILFIVMPITVAILLVIATNITSQPSADVISDNNDENEQKRYACMSYLLSRGVESTRAARDCTTLYTTAYTSPLPTPTVLTTTPSPSDSPTVTPTIAPTAAPTVQPTATTPVNTPLPSIPTESPSPWLTPSPWTSTEPTLEPSPTPPAARLITDTFTYTPPAYLENLVNNDVRLALLEKEKQEALRQAVIDSMITRAKELAANNTDVLSIKAWPKWFRNKAGNVRPNLKGVGCATTQSQIMLDTGVIEACYPLVADLYRALVNPSKGRPTGKRINSRAISLRDLTKYENAGKLKEGDLIFFRGAARSGSWGHVGLYIGDGRIVDTSSQAGKVRNRIAMRLWGTYKTVDIVRIVDPPTKALLKVEN